MIHDFFYILHVLGMAIILITSLLLSLKKEIAYERKKKFSLYMMSAAHTQLLSGVILFFLMISEVHYPKIGVKVFLAAIIAILATQHKKKISEQDLSQRIIPTTIALLAILTTLIAFLA